MNHGKEPKIFEAIRKGDITAVRTRLWIHKLTFGAFGEGVSTTDVFGNTPLHCAATIGSSEITKILLDHGADPNEKGCASNTPLHEAAKGMHTEVARVLLNAGADIGPINFYGNSPLDEAKKQKHQAEETLQESIDEKSRFYAHEKEAVRRGRILLYDPKIIADRDDLIRYCTKTIEEYKKFEAFINNALGARRSLGSQVSNAAASPDTEAIPQGLLQRARQALTKAPPHLKLESKEPSSDVYKELKKPAIDILFANAALLGNDISLFLEAGADPNAKVALGGLGQQSILHFAVSGRNHDNVCRLIQAGADVNALNEHNETVLAKSQTREIAKTLLDAGAEVKEEEISSLVSKSEGAEIIKLLAKKGYSIDTPDNGSKTPLMRAVALGEKECVKDLLDLGANVNAQSALGQTPLHHLVHNTDFPDDRIEILEMLVGAGADMTIADKDGKTASDVIAERQAESDPYKKNIAKIAAAFTDIGMMPSVESLNWCHDPHEFVPRDDGLTP